MTASVPWAISRRAFAAGVMASLTTTGFANSAKTKRAAVPKVSVTPPLFGSAKATKRFALWGSYTCPFTAMLVPILLQIVRDNPQRASLEWHHFPAHPPDPALHVAGLSFAGTHFWNFTSAVLAIVYAAGGNFSDLTEPKIIELAVKEGGSRRTLDAAYTDQSKWRAVKDDLLAGQLLGVVKTPGLFVDGYFLTPAGIPMDTKAFDASLRTMLTKS